MVTRQNSIIPRIAEKFIWVPDELGKEMLSGKKAGRMWVQHHYGACTLHIGDAKIYASGGGIYGRILSDGRNFNYVDERFYWIDILRSFDLLSKEIYSPRWARHFDGEFIQY